MKIMCVFAGHDYDDTKMLLGRPYRKCQRCGKIDL